MNFKTSLNLPDSGKLTANWKFYQLRKSQET